MPRSQGQPEAPRLLCHYDADVSGNTTGIAISGNILALAGTSLGMELVDVSNRPDKSS
jgi:hypothetical protein